MHSVYHNPDWAGKLPFSLPHETWLMKEFGQSCYESYVYFNFDEEDELRSIFEVNKNPLAGFNKSDSLLNVVLNITEIFADALPRWY